MAKTHKGLFKPSNPSKYKGNPTRIIYRSSWERRMMLFLDRNPNIIEWASEELWVPYISPVDGKCHRYFPDFVIKHKKKDGTIGTTMIEIKPSKQCKAPTAPKRRTKKYLQEVATYGINMSKWKSAKEFCADRNWAFAIITEKEIGVLTW